MENGSPTKSRGTKISHQAIFNVSKSNGIIARVQNFHCKTRRHFVSILTVRKSVHPRQPCGVPRQSESSFFVRCRKNYLHNTNCTGLVFFQETELPARGFGGKFDPRCLNPTNSSRICTKTI